MNAFTRRFAAGILPAVAALLLIASPRVARAEVYSLERCIATALDRNEDLRAAEAGYGIAEKQVREAWSGVFPSLTGNASLTRNLTADKVFLPALLIDSTAAQDEVVPVQFSGDNIWSASLTLEQTIFQGDVFIGIGAAARFRAYQSEVARGVRQNVVTSVRRSYYSALLAREGVRLTEESLRRVGQTLEEARAMNRAGVASDYDVLRLEVEYANLEPELRRARNAVDAADRQLRVLMGIGIEAPLEVVGALREIDPGALAAGDPDIPLLGVRGLAVGGPGDIDRLLETTGRERSELRRARLDRELASTEMSVERARLLPNLNMFASYRLSAQENGTLDFFGENADQRTSSWQAGLRLEIPIFEGGRKWSLISQKRLNVERKKAQERLAEHWGENEVRTGLQDLLEARQRAVAQARAVDQAQRGFEIATAEYREGVGSRLQVTDAEVALRQTQFNYAQAVYDVLESQALLDLAVGIVPSVDDVAGEPASAAGEPASVE